MVWSSLETRDRRGGVELCTENWTGRKPYRAGTSASAGELWKVSVAVYPAKIRMLGEFSVDRGRLEKYCELVALSHGTCPADKVRINFLFGATCHTALRSEGSAYLCYRYPFNAVWRALTLR